MGRRRRWSSWVVVVGDHRLGFGCVVCWWVSVLVGVLCFSGCWWRVGVLVGMLFGGA